MVLSVMRLAIRQQKWAQLSCIPDRELTTFSFTKNQPDSRLKIENSREILVGGKLYDVVRKYDNGKQIKYFCVHDHEEETLISKTRLFNSKAQQMPIQNTARNIIDKIIKVTGYYTLLANAFVIQPFLYGGQDSVMFDGTLCGVQAMQNTDQANIYGFEANMLAQLTKTLSLRSTLTYTFGHVKTEDVPLDHIPPMFGLTSLKLELSKFTGEVYSRYNAWKHIEDYSPSGEDNEAYATADGMPTWFTLNLRTGYQFNRNISLQAGVENILDKYYRNFASGISASGRNIFVTLRANL